MPLTLKVVSVGIMLKISPSRSHVLRTDNANDGRDVTRLWKLSSKRNLERGCLGRWQGVTVLFVLADICPLACRVEKINVELNLFPRHSAAVRNRADDRYRRARLCVAERNSTVGDMNLVFVGLVILASVENAGEHNQHRHYRY